MTAKLDLISDRQYVPETLARGFTASSQPAACCAILLRALAPGTLASHC